MNIDRFFSMLSNVDDDLILAADKKPAAALWSTRRTLAVAACLALIVGIVLLSIPYIPKEYDLDYEYYQSDDGTTRLKSKSLWIYYVKNSEMLREYARLPLCTKNVFTAWKYKNGVGEDVKLLSVSFSENGEQAKERTSDITQTYTLKNGSALTVTVSAELEAYIEKTGELLMESLEKTLLGYSSIDYRALKATSESDDTESTDTQTDIVLCESHLLKRLSKV